MTYQKMPETLRRKFRRTNANVCPICGTEISKVEDCQYLTYPYGRYMFFHFIHTNCLVNSKRAGVQQSSLVNQQ